MPPPSDIDLVHHETQLAVWLQDDQNNEVSDLITSFSGSHLRPTPRPGSACSRLDGGWCRTGGMEVPSPSGTAWARHEVSQYSCTLGFVVPKLTNSHSRNLTRLTSAPWAKLARAMAEEAMEVTRVVMPHCDVSGGSQWEPLPQTQRCPWTPPGSDLTPLAAGTTSSQPLLAQMAHPEVAGPCGSKKPLLVVPSSLSLPSPRAVPPWSHQAGDPAEAVSAVLCPAPGSAARERRGTPGRGPVDSYKND